MKGKDKGQGRIMSKEKGRNDKKRTKRTRKRERREE